ncbi:hypothetical protein [Micromonospora mirobrigensis]|uniref:Glycosyl hydrolase family 76 n=1 Tax=Micromonospora mirobrigensis TaxID=262898 RepID=A0A1C5ALC8_9ACTN|nr:hypothetical protein [Micromonospora mirobrigensis]SCF45804.1 hypothetical protein GA0070564_11232 [Micromonospora mirobrigensis]
MRLRRSLALVATAGVTLLATLTAPATPAAAAGSAVVPIVMSNFSSTHPNDAGSVRLRAILRNTNQFALTTWYNETKNYDAQIGAYLTFGGTAEDNIRPPAAQAFGLAVSLKLGVYQTGNNSNPSPSATEAKTKTVRLISSLAYRHLVNTSGGWGNAWQSAHWAAFAGFAGWLMWDDLSTTDREYVRKMVEYEANRFNSYTVPYYRSATGAFLTPGDTKAEENAWNAQVLQVATAMMPTHPNYGTWMRKSAELMISATARPSDVTSTTVVNGRTLADWLDGSNTNADGTMTNHDRVHPDYMEAISLNLHAGLTSSLAGKGTPRAALFNAGVVYDALVDLNFVVGQNPYAADPRLTRTNAAPGGTIYRDGSSDIYYPNGNDWGTQRRMQFATMDVFADAFGIDALASQKGAYWEQYHAQKVLDMQNRFTDRRTYLGAYNDVGSEDTYPGREEWVSHHAGWAYLARWIKYQNAFSISDQAY